MAFKLTTYGKKDYFCWHFSYVNRPFPTHLYRKMSSKIKILQYVFNLKAIEKLGGLPYSNNLRGFRSFSQFKRYRYYTFSIDPIIKFWTIWVPRMTKSVHKHKSYNIENYATLYIHFFLRFLVRPIYFFFKFFNQPISQFFNRPRVPQLKILLKEPDYPTLKERNNVDYRGNDAIKKIHRT